MLKNGIAVAVDQYIGLFLYNTKRGQCIGLLWLQVFYIGEDLVAEGLRSLPARKSSKCSKSNLLVGDNVVVLERYVVLGS